MRLLLTLAVLCGSMHGQLLQQIVQQSAPVASASWGTPTHFVASCASGTTCAVPSVTIGAGNLVIIQARTLAAVSITATDVAGTPVDCGTRAGTQGNRSDVTCGYILSGSAVSNATVTVTFSGTTGGARTNIRVYPYSGGTPALDAIADLSANSGQSGTTFVGSAMTLTGSSDIVAVAASAFDSGGSSHSVSAVNGSWTRTDFSAAGFADQASVTSITAPTWTTTTAFTIIATSAVAFGFSPTPCVNYGIMDSSGGTAAAAPTAATVYASTFGAAGFSNPSLVSGLPWYYTVNNASTFMTYATAAHHALNGSAPRFCFGGATYSDSGNLGVALDTTGTGTVRNVVLKVPWGDTGTTTLSPVTTLGVFFKTSLSSASSVNMDVLTINTPVGGDFANAILHATAGVLRIELEGSASTPITISSNTWYQITLKSDANVGASLQVWSEDGSTQIGTTQTVAYTGTPAFANVVAFGDGSGSAVTTGNTIYWDKFAPCYLNTGTACPFPLKQ